MRLLGIALIMILVALSGCASLKEKTNGVTLCTPDNKSILLEKCTLIKTEGEMVIGRDDNGNRFWCPINAFQEGKGCERVNVFDGH